MFKVGDIVRGTQSHEVLCRRGATGKIKKIEGVNIFVEWDNDPGAFQISYENELELLTPKRNGLSAFIKRVEKEYAA